MKRIKKLTEDNIKIGMVYYIKNSSGEEFILIARDVSESPLTHSTVIEFEATYTTRSNWEPPHRCHLSLPHGENIEIYLLESDEEAFTFMI